MGDRDQADRRGHLIAAVAWRLADQGGEGNEARGCISRGKEGPSGASGQPLPEASRARASSSDSFGRSAGRVGTAAIGASPVTPEGGG